MVSSCRRTKYFQKIRFKITGTPNNARRSSGNQNCLRFSWTRTFRSIRVADGKKLDGDQSLVYSLHGDGELQEGQIWEALMYAAAKKVDNIISTIDYNGRQIDGDTDDVLSLGNLHAKLEAFGWIVLEEKMVMILKL